jgi:hypothetical protein
LSTYITSQSGINDWTILVDGSLSSGSPSISSGSFALPLSTRFEALADDSVASGYPTLSGDDVSFTGANAVSFVNFPFIQFNNSSGPSIFTVTSGQTLNVELINSTILAGFNPFFSASGGGVVNITMHEFAVLGSAPGPGPSPVVLTVDSTSSAFIIEFDASQLVAGAASVASGGSLGIYLVDSANVDSSYSTQSGVTVNLLSQAPNVAYTPSTPSNWSPIPTQVAQALDELAAQNSTTSGQITLILAQIASLVSQVTTLTAQVATLTAQVATLTARVIALSTSNAQLTNDVAALKQEQKVLKKKITVFEKKQDVILCKIRNICEHCC